ncbi:MAG: hypothetical protein SWH68_15320 [Thermodesulfobacteriota bacterium]|nr:hypothetical protein [Thermodesulfobacteriota bacterium]
MRNFMTIFFITFCLIFVSSAASAFDYHNWIPLLSESIGGMDKQGEPEGLNMEKGGQSWSSIRQQYADAAGKNISLSIITGSDAPGIREFKTMQKFNMENEKKKIKALEVSGHKAVLAFNKKGGRSNLLIAAQDETLVVIETSSFDSEADLVALADDIPLAEIADSVK